jgi:hypothetical protein
VCLCDCVRVCLCGVREFFSFSISTSNDFDEHTSPSNREQEIVHIDK